MARNSNINFPKYIQNDIESAEIAKPIRNRKTQKTIYIWQTNRSSNDVETSKGPLILQSKVVATVKLQPTTPIGGDFLKPKFESLTGTSIYATTPKGFIFEEFSYDSNFYCFATFDLPKTDQEFKTIEKFRITHNEPIISPKAKFLYYDFSAVAETSNSIKNYQNIVFKLVSEFNTDKKTKYIWIEFDSDILLMAKSLKFSLIPNLGDQRRNVGFSIINQVTNATLKFIKIRQSFPFLFDDLTFDRLTKTNGILSVELRPPDRNGAGDTSNFADIILPTTLTYGSATIDVVKEDGGIDYYDPTKYTTWTRTNFVYKKFFTFNIVTSVNGNGSKARKQAKISERILTPQELSSFLNGDFQIESSTIPSTMPYSITNSEQTINDLSEANEVDRCYFVLSSLTNFNDFFHANFTSGGTTQGLERIHQFNTVEPKTGTSWGTIPTLRTISSSEWISRSIKNPTKIVLQCELQADGFNPIIEISPLISKKIKITTFDSTMYKLTENNFDTNFSYDETSPEMTINL